MAHTSGQRASAVNCICCSGRQSRPTRERRQSISSDRWACAPSPRARSKWLRIPIRAESGSKPKSNSNSQLPTSNFNSNSNSNSARSPPTGPSNLASAACRPNWRIRTTGGHGRNLRLICAPPARSLALWGARCPATSRRGAPAACALRSLGAQSRPSQGGGQAAAPLGRLKAHLRSSAILRHMAAAVAAPASRLQATRSPSPPNDLTNPAESARETAARSPAGRF